MAPEIADRISARHFQRRTYAQGEFFSSTKFKGDFKGKGHGCTFLTLFTENQVK
jgi:hypothetical protein